jgi:hypothetical protein
MDEEDVFEQKLSFTMLANKHIVSNPLIYRIDKKS